MNASPASGTGSRRYCGCPPPHVLGWTAQETTLGRRPYSIWTGPLADTGHRQHFLEGRRRDWAAFFAAAIGVPPLEEGVRLAMKSADECEVIYPAGRSGRCRRDALAWPALQGLAGRAVCTCGASTTVVRPSRKLERLGRKREVWSSTTTTSSSAMRPNWPDPVCCELAGRCRRRS